MDTSRDLQERGQAGIPPVFCVGCGSDLTNKSTDRRNLRSAVAEHVATIWKELLEQIVDEEESNVDIDASKIISGDKEPARGGRMCRKCFKAYEHYHALHKSLVSNLKKALDVLVSTTLSSSAKRSRLESVESKPRASTSTCMLPVQQVSSSTSASPDVAIDVGYTIPKRYILTPTRKHLGKAVARRSQKTIAVECMKDPCTRQVIMKLLGKEVHKEIRVMASESFLCSQSNDDLKEFKWDRLHRELSHKAPVLLSILVNATNTRIPRPNSHVVIGICVAILLKHRNHKMSLLQKIISLVLYAGHASKQVYERLQKLNLSISHSHLLRLVDKLGLDHDARVLHWRDGLIAKIKNSTSAQSGLKNHISYGSDGSSDESSNYDSDSDSDYSYQAISPFTSEDEYSSSESTDESESILPEFDSSPPTTSLPEIQQPTTSTVAQGDHTTLFRLCGDNIDKTVKRRYIRSDTRKTESIHYFHSYAVADRIDFSSLSDTVPPIPRVDIAQLATSLLPSQDDDAALRKNFATLVSRILFDNIEFFKLTFDGVIEWHIEHDFYEQMSRKSDVVPLGIIPKNENKGDEMVEIMTNLHKYVPLVEYTEDHFISDIGQTVQVPNAFIKPVLMGGDQLTAARGRGAKKAKVHADSPTSRLEGLIPVAEDWHTKVVLLEVIWKYFYSMLSSGEHGTLYQLRNLINRTNVVKDPKSDFNACNDFFILIVTCYIIVAALSMLKMKSTNDSPSEDVLPNAQQLWMQSADERKAVLNKVSQQVVDSFIDFSFYQVWHRNDTDKVADYGKQLLGLGCFYLEFTDAIHEGDGQRVLRCWRYLLPIFLGSGRTNYSCEVLNMLFQASYALSPRLSAELLWSRFINVHGHPGKNIPADLHMEHLNRLIKEAIRNLGANKTKNAIARIGRAIGTIAPVLQHFDQENSVTSISGAHRIASFEKDRNIVVSELVKSEVFSTVPNRKHNTFPHPRHVLHARKRDELLTWMIGRLQKHHV